METFQQTKRLMKRSWGRCCISLSFTDEFSCRKHTAQLLASGAEAESGANAAMYALFTSLPKGQSSKELKTDKSQFKEFCRNTNLIECSPCRSQCSKVRGPWFEPHTFEGQPKASLKRLRVDSSFSVGGLFRCICSPCSLPGIKQTNQ